LTERFHTGVNYWPGSSAMRWWRRFDEDEVGRDFARVRDAGGDLVRFFLLWEDFQPDPATVSERALANLKTVASVAARTSVRIIPTLFTGHMSGANFIPAWALGRAGSPARFRIVAGDRVTDRTVRNWYADAQVADAQAMLARECARALAGHPALWGWDLGNENSNCCVPPTRDDGLRWLDRMADAIRSTDATCHITLGLHLEDLEEDRRIGPAEGARVCDVLSMHGYPIYASWSRGPRDDGFVPFLARVTRWLGRKDVLFAEFGAPTHDGDAGAEGASGSMLLSEREAGEYLTRASARLRDAGTTGALVWCFSDYARAIWHEPPLDLAPHERHFGIWRADGSAKPGASALAGGADRLPPESDPPEWDERLRASFYTAPNATLMRLYAASREPGTLARPLL
jgi:endo-1,4-beta-mannosidase